MWSQLIADIPSGVTAGAVESDLCQSLVDRNQLNCELDLIDSAEQRQRRQQQQILEIQLDALIVKNEMIQQLQGFEDCHMGQVRRRTQLRFVVSSTFLPLIGGFETIF